jgi:hypothetical protein
MRDPSMKARNCTKKRFCYLIWDILSFIMYRYGIAQNTVIEQSIIYY